MAATQDGTAQAACGYGSGNHSVTFSTSGTNRLCVIHVGLCNWGGGGTPGAPSSPNLTWVQASAALYGSVVYARTYWAWASSALTNETVTVNFSGTGGDWFLTASAWSGARNLTGLTAGTDFANPTATGHSTAESVSVTTRGTDSVIVGGSMSAVTGWSANGSTTVLATHPWGYGASWLARITGSANGTYTLGGTMGATDDWAIAAIEILAPSSGTTASARCSGTANLVASGSARRAGKTTLQASASARRSGTSTPLASGAARRAGGTTVQATGTARRAGKTTLVASATGRRAGSTAPQASGTVRRAGTALPVVTATVRRAGNATPQTSGAGRRAGTASPAVTANGRRAGTAATLTASTSARRAGTSTPAVPGATSASARRSGTSSLVASGNARRAGSATPQATGTSRRSGTSALVKTDTTRRAGTTKLQATTTSRRSGAATLQASNAARRSGFATPTASAASRRAGTTATLTGTSTARRAGTATPELPGATTETARRAGVAGLVGPGSARRAGVTTPQATSAARRSGTTSPAVTGAARRAGTTDLIKTGLSRRAGKTSLVGTSQAGDTGPIVGTVTKEVVTETITLSLTTEEILALITEDITFEMSENVMQTPFLIQIPQGDGESHKFTMTLNGVAQVLPVGTTVTLRVKKNITDADPLFMENCPLSADRTYATVPIRASRTATMTDLYEASIRVISPDEDPKTRIGKIHVLRCA